MNRNKWCRTMAVALALGFVLSGCGKQEGGQPPTAASAQSELQKLSGKWLRPDGGYILEIKSVAADGKVDAAYFNPNPIKIAKAEATLEGGATKVFVELRDINYPGCTYTLTYDAPEDQLRGVYFQAAMQQNFDIVFVRMK